MTTFDGAKILILIGGQMVTLQRDDRPDIPFPGLWDLPGGGREGDETPEACAIRETHEELNLVVPPEAILYRRAYLAPALVWTLAARLPEAAAGTIRLGDEGQRWALMRPEDWIARDDVIPHFRSRVTEALAAITGL